VEVGGARAVLGKTGLASAARLSGCQKVSSGGRLSSPSVDRGIALVFNSMGTGCFGSLQIDETGGDECDTNPVINPSSISAFHGRFLFRNSIQYAIKADRR
jgi:hypothetical protein